jgi:hypothetical protein
MEKYNYILITIMSFYIEVDVVISGLGSSKRQEGFSVNGGGYSKIEG